MKEKRINELEKKKMFSKDFILVTFGRIISVFGNQILRYALPLYLLNATGSALLFGTILGIASIPMLILLPIGGVLVDRLNKRNIMLIMDLFTGILITGFCLLSNSAPIVPLVSITVIILYGLDGIDRPTVKASIPALVEPSYMMKANSIIDIVDSSASVAGPVAGGLLFSVFGLTPILYVSIFCFFASVILDMFIHIPYKKQKKNAGMIRSGFYDLKESFNFLIKEKPILWKISLLFGVSNLLLTTLIIIGIPVIITQFMGFGVNQANKYYGYAQGVLAGGAVLGGVLSSFIGNKLKPNKAPFILIGCSLCAVLSGLVLMFSNDVMVQYIVLILSCGLLLALHTVFQLQVVTLMQILTPQHLIGKVISCFIMIVMSTTPIGQFIYGFLFEHIANSHALIFIVSGLLMVFLSIMTKGIFKNISDGTGNNSDKSSK